MIRIRNAVAVAEAVGNPPGICTTDGILTAWPKDIPEPTQEQVEAWEAAWRPPADPVVSRIDALEAEIAALKRKP